MDLGNFLNKWYNIDHGVKCTNVNVRQINLGVDLFPGNLKKIISKLRHITNAIAGTYSTKPYFYSYNKNVYSESRFVYFEYVFHIIERMKVEMPDLIILDGYNIEDVYKFKENNKTTILRTFEGFWTAGNLSLTLQRLPSQAEIEYINSIINESYAILLDKIKGIVEKQEPFYTMSIIIEDKETSMNDVKVNLNYFQHQIITSIENNSTLSSELFLETLDLLPTHKRHIDALKELNEFIDATSLGYHVGHVFDELNSKFLDLVIEVLKSKDCNLFTINSEKDFECFNEIKLDNSYYGPKYRKTLLLNGYISILDVKKIAKDLHNNKDFSQLFLSSIKD